MNSPIETIAARVLADHELVADWRPHPDGFQRLRSKCAGCEWEAAVEDKDAHVAHQAAEIARAVAEDADLESLLWAAIATARDAEPRLPNDADTGDVTAAVIDALTREEDR